MQITKNQKTYEINEWIIIDPEIVEVLNNLSEESNKEQYLQHALKIGIIALKSTQVMEKVDYVEKSFNTMNTDIKTMFNGCFGDKGTMETLFSTTNKEGPVGKFLEELKTNFGEDGKIPQYFSAENTKSPVYQMIQKIEATFGEKGTIYTALDATEPTSPLSKLRTQIEEGFKDLRDEITTRRAEEELKEKTPLKGKDYEETIQDYMGAICTQYGDEFANVSELPGGAGAKKGDFLITVQQSMGKTIGKIVVEAKSGKVTLAGKNSLIDILNESMVARDAQYAIAVVRDIENFTKKQQKEIGHFMAAGSNKIICIANEENWLPLELAYKSMRNLIDQPLSKEVKLDLNQIEEIVKNILNKVQQFKDIRTLMTKNIINSTNDIQEKIKAVEEQLKEELENLKKEIGIGT